MTVGLLIVVPIVILVARYLWIERSLQQEVFPRVRAQADDVRSLSASLGLVETSRIEQRGWFDPFCSLIGIPANRLSVDAGYRVTTGAAAGEVLHQYHEQLQAAGWSFPRGTDPGLAEGSDCSLYFLPADLFRNFALKHTVVLEHILFVLSRRIRGTDDLYRETIRAIHESKDKIKELVPA